MEGKVHKPYGISSAKNKKKIPEAHPSVSLHYMQPI